MHAAEQETEVRDAILFVARNPRVKLDFEFQRMSMARLLMSPSRYGRFCAFLERCVDRVVVVPASVVYAGQGGRWFEKFLIDRLEVWIKVGFGQRWMEMEVGDLDVNWLAKWRLGLGLPDGVRVVPRVLPRFVVTHDRGTQTRADIDAVATEAG